MKKTKPIAVHVDRLVEAFAAQGVELKRTRALEIVAAAFGFHNTHECTAASKRGDLSPPAAVPVCRIDIPGGETLIVVRDPVSGAPYAIDETFVDQVAGDERREAYGPSPYGRLLDLGDIGIGQVPSTPAPDRSDVPHDGIVRILVELATTGSVTDEVVRSNVQRAVEAWKGNVGLSADDDEGMVDGVLCRMLDPTDRSPAASGKASDGLVDSLRTGGNAGIHAAIIHSKHGVELRLGTTLANVSRQMGDYVRENWDDAWQADQNVEEKDRIGVPETPEGLDDDQAEQMYFEALGAASTLDYVDYEVITLDDVLSPTSDMPSSPSTETTIQPVEPFPGVPADLYSVVASRDGHVFDATFRLEDGENEEDRGRELAARAFGLDLDDFYDDDVHDEDYEPTEDEEDEARDARNCNFDADIDSIEIGRASFADDLLPILQASWEAAHRLPLGDPLRDVIRRQVMDAMPSPEKN